MCQYNKTPDCPREQSYPQSSFDDGRDDLISTPPWSSDAERNQQLTDIIDAGDDDNAACAAADLFQESPNQEP